MNNIDRQAQMMDYLYGEMPEQERQEYEHWLAQHPEVQAELDELQTSRNWLSEVEDVVPKSSLVKMPQAAKWNRSIWYRTAAAAAAILALWLFNFQIHSSPGGLTLSFGQPASLPSSSSETIAEAQALQMKALETLLATQQDQLEQKLLARDSTWENRFASLQNDNQQQWARVKYQQRSNIQAIKAEFTQEELPRLANLMQQLQIEQQEELQLLLVEFWNTWVQTRETDLENLDVKMTNLYQNVERNQQESEARVVNYIQNVAER